MSVNSVTVSRESLSSLSAGEGVFAVKVNVNGLADTITTETAQSLPEKFKTAPEVLSCYVRSPDTTTIATAKAILTAETIQVVHGGGNAIPEDGVDIIVLIKGRLS